MSNVALNQTLSSQGTFLWSVYAGYEPMTTPLRSPLVASREFIRILYSNKKLNKLFSSLFTTLTVRHYFSKENMTTVIAKTFAMKVHVPSQSVELNLLSGVHQIFTAMLRKLAVTW